VLAEEVVRREPSCAPASLEEGGLPPDAPSRTIALPARETRTIAERPATPRRPSVHRKIDLNLKQAKTGDALGLIADAGGFDVVLDGDLSAPVTVSLHRVDAFDALLVVAEAQGLGVTLERGVVMVGGPRPRADAR
jgi:hypothetical protein